MQVLIALHRDKKLNAMCRDQRLEVSNARMQGIQPCHDHSSESQYRKGPHQQHGQEARGPCSGLPSHPSPLTQRDGRPFDFHMNFGLHAGWAIEGAVGSPHKASRGSPLAPSHALMPRDGLSSSRTCRLIPEPYTQVP
jgi:hypothetical protein